MFRLYSIQSLLKIFTFFLILITLFSCSTINFGKPVTYSTNKESKQIEEVDLSFNYTVMGIPVSGEKSVVEYCYRQQSTDRIFYVISYPAVGILRTDKLHNEFSFKKFKSRSLDELFGYVDINSDDASKKDGRNTYKRPFVNFKESSNNKNMMFFSIEHTLFMTNDGGDNWKMQQLPFNPESQPIYDIEFISDSEIVIITSNRIFYSINAGKNWSELRLNNDSFYAYKYSMINVASIDNNLFFTVRQNDEADSLLSKECFNFLYVDNTTTGDLKSGVFKYDLKKKEWKKIINIPLIPHLSGEIVRWSQIYPMDLYLYNFTENFKKNALFKAGILNNRTNNLNEYLEYLDNTTAENFMIFSPICNKSVVFDENYGSYIIESIEDYNQIVLINNKVESLRYVKKVNNVSENGDDQFCFRYNIRYIFNKWTAGLTNGGSRVYNNDNSFIRFTISDEFKRFFNRYILDKMMKNSGIHPFLQKKNEYNLIEPHLDPTNGQTYTIEISKDGKEWKQIVDTSYIRNISDPLSQKRSAIFWYRNIEQKKNFKLSLSFGFDNSNSYLVYPDDIIINDEFLFTVFNYFSIQGSYRDVFKIKFK